MSRPLDEYKKLAGERELPPTLRAHLAKALAEGATEADVVFQLRLAALEACEGCVSAAARMLEVDRRTLHRRPRPRSGSRHGNHGRAKAARGPVHPGEPG